MTLWYVASPNCDIMGSSNNACISVYGMILCVVYTMIMYTNIAFVYSQVPPQ